MWSFEGPYRLHRGDCIEHMASLPSHVFDLAVFSPPFPGLYAYTDSNADVGNSEDMRGDAKLHLSFFYHQFARLLKPGRVVIVHVQQIPRMKRSGGRGLYDFRGLNIRLGERAGLVFEYDWSVRKNPQAQAIRTKSHNLQFAGLERDRANARGALDDYLLKFVAPGENAVAVDSDDQVSRNDWINWAEGRWDNIRENDTLNGEKGKERARGEGDVKHICPLQLEVIERVVRLYSNPGELVFSPFAGIGSELVTALRLGRRAYGCELKPEYQAECVRNCDVAVASKKQLTLLDGFADVLDAPAVTVAADPEPLLAEARERVLAEQQLPSVPAEEVLGPLVAEPEPPAAAVEGEKRTAFASGEIVTPPKFPDPGPDLAIADMPLMPPVVAAALAAKGVRALNDIRPLFESKAAIDLESEPAFAVLKDLCGDLTLFDRYKAGGAFIQLLGGRAHMLKVMSLWPRSRAVAHDVPGPALNDGAPLHPEPEPEPEQTLGPLAFPCAKCKSPAGAKCKNYLGKGKPPCPNRGKAPPAAKPVHQTTPGLFAGIDQQTS